MGARLGASRNSRIGSVFRNGTVSGEQAQVNSLHPPPLGRDGMISSIHYSGTSKLTVIYHLKSKVPLKKFIFHLAIKLPYTWHIRPSLDTFQTSLPTPFVA